MMEVNLLYWLPLVALAILALIYRRVSKHYSYFHSKPIPSLAPVFPFGSAAPLFLKKYSFPEYVQMTYNKFPDAKVFGMFDMFTPLFTIRDPELIKKVLVKDFEYFIDRRSLFGDDAINSESILITKTLLLLTGQKWRDMRATLSPAFTGSKMRAMFELIVTYSDGMVRILKDQAGGEGSVDYEMKECCSRIASDIIATCAYGLEVESLANRENDFYMTGKKMMNFGSVKIVLRVLAYSFFPGLMSKLGVDLFDGEQIKYFTEIIKQTVKTRDSRGIVRPDMIHLLMQAKKGTLKHQQETAEVSAGFATVEESEVGKSTTGMTMSDPEFIAQCLIFFVAGFESISTEMSFMCYELAVNPEAQQKLYEEIVETNTELAGKPLTYDTLQKMKYMDMVTAETLRMWSGPATDRKCVRDYVLDDGCGLKFTIDKGTCLSIPTYAIHRDPKYYPDPDKFDPERFSEENRGNVNMTMYLPFGAGPRNCIGSRFALMEMKAVVYALLLNFCLERTEKTPVPLKLAKGFTALGAAKGLHLRLRLRLNIHSSAFNSVSVVTGIAATMDVNLLFLLIVVASLVVIYRRVTKHFHYFHDKPIPSMASNPLFGSTGPLMRKKLSFNDFIEKVYNKYPNAKVFGMFDMSSKMFVLRDPELIKKITVKDFDHFINRRSLFGDSDKDDGNENILFNKALVSLNDERWRDMRAILSPAFTGSKMRAMFELIEEYSVQMVDILKEQSRDTGYVDYEMKDCFSRMANDIIATCAFGLQVESLKSRENEFFVAGKTMMNFSRLTMLPRILGIRFFPKLMVKMGVDIVERQHAQYFSKIIKEAVRNRDSHGIVRPDMIHLLMQARKGVLKHQQETAEASAGFATVEESDVGKTVISRAMTEPEFIAQCLIFFLAGLDTVSTAMVFMAYELAMNPDVQQKLSEEIAEANKQLARKPLTYDTLQKMKYMDMVVSESLRKWPVPVFDRKCVRDYVVDDDAGLKFTIDAGACIWVPVHGIHRDPKYYPNPEKFDPERFSEENRANIDMTMYMPFGSGPRNCIGSRFALMEIKAIMYALLLNFSIERNEKTEVPLKLVKGFMALGVENGLHLRLKLRK
ncbi:uncharacterized protein LOC135703195 [Ochlerotatus camptorhynchus]|uniref:uncharacterized protein LOC135703195 n=1 Tax=Ochlerotatus camptorhynchus TaxID=644619 RepID=UPI0031D8B644